MTLIHYKNFNLRKSSLEQIERINVIIDEFQAEGFTPTLRQIYYQLVQANVIPNSEQSYNNLSVLIKKGRYMGLISWTAIEDRNRSLSRWTINPNPVNVLDGIEYQLALDLWKPQNIHIELWVEKDAQSQVVERACREYRVPFMPCRGYMSTSEIWRAGRRFERAEREGKRSLMIHVGDHDPSGWDMTRDNEARLSEIAGFDVPVNRVALNTDQVRQHNLTPQWAKVSDKRFPEYAKKYGDKSYELDALRPSILIKLITDAIEACIPDRAKWDRCLAAQAKAREPLKQLAPRWRGEIRHWLKNGPPEPPAAPDAIEYAWEP